MPAKLLEEELTYKVIGILFKVHNKLGPLYQEKYYQRAIENEFVVQKVSFLKEHPVNIKYSGDKIGLYRIDFLVENKLILETKSVSKILPKYFQQLLAYLNELQIRIGLIANFKYEKLGLKRLILPDKYLFSSVSHQFKSV